MSKVSIIIPSRGEKSANLNRTLKSIEENAVGEYEVIVGMNGKPYTNLWSFDMDLKVIQIPENIGIKGMINLLATLATGKYIYKSDAHCSFSQSFNQVLQQGMQDDWIVTPRFYDYFYLSCPFTDKRGLRFKAGGHWPERTLEKLNSHLDIDETPQIHGSGWFMTKERFFELGGFPINDPYGHGQEPLWLGLKNWLMGGKVMVNKKAWYAHLHQDSRDRGYPENKEETERTYRITAEYWLKHPKFEEFVEKFMPMPTWPEDWKEQLRVWRKNNG